MLLNLFDFPLGKFYLIFLFPMENAMECAQQQVAEMQLLLSMFTPEELTIDQDALDMLVQYSELGDPEMPYPDIRLGFQLKFNVDSQSDSASYPIQLDASIPQSYPNVPPLVFVSATVTREAQDVISKEIKEKKTVLEIIQWIQENVAEYLQKKEDKSESSTQKPEVGKFRREWVWFHHIYSKRKRAHIVDWARDFGLTGFVLAGKPGIVCIEGPSEQVQEYVQKLRGLSWKKMSTRLVQEEIIEGNLDSSEKKLRKFQDFEEISDMTSYLGYLTQLGLQDAFKEVFGL